MATYTVNISGSLSNSLAYATVAGKIITSTGTTTYTSKPTVVVYVDANYSGYRSRCKVTMNGTTVKSGSGSYTADIGDADIVNINFTATWSGSYIYHICDITTEKTPPPDPMAPHDGHNTNIGNVAYQTEGGTVRMNGVGYEIASGMTLVNGVAREIAFATLCTVTITGSGSSAYCCLTINGTTYTGAATVEVEPGTIVSCYVALGQVPGTVKLNGKEVANSGSSSVTYNYAVEKNVQISLSFNTYSRISTISITE